MEENKIQIFQTDDGKVELEVMLEQETVWLTQEQMAKLFDVQKAAISKHLINIYVSEELSRKATVSKMETVQQEGSRKVARQVEHYNLDAVISVGYRVNSTRATRFRQWATGVLRKHLIQSYSLNQQRLESQKEKLIELRQAIALSSRLIQKKDLSTDESQAILAVADAHACRRAYVLASFGLC